MATSIAAAGMSLVNLAVAFNQRINVRSNCLLQIRNYAARKGTREKARKKKVKVEVKKKEFIPHNIRFKKTEIIPLDQIRFYDLHRLEPVDDVWLRKYHRKKVYPFAEAVQGHRETCHPTVFNLPNAYLNAFIELDMTGDRPTKIVEGFSRVVQMPHGFEHGEERKVIAFAKSPEFLAMAQKAGASMTGSKDLISKIQIGEVSIDDFNAVVAHPEIMAELSVIKGILKRKYPSPRAGTLGMDFNQMIKRVLHGIRYTAVAHNRQPLYGTIETPIGRLDNDLKNLEENFAALLKDVQKVKPKRDGPFIWRVSLMCPPSEEQLKVDIEPYFKEMVPTAYDSDDDEEELIIENSVL